MNMRMHTDAKRFYSQLGLDPDCSDEDIRVAFRRRAKELHPDSETGDAVAFIRLKRAYDTLSDTAQRARYDRANSVRVRRAMRAATEPLPPLARPRRQGGMSFARYVAAFIFMGGLSFGAIEAMIDYTEDQPVRTAAPPSLLSSAPTREAAKEEAALGERAGRTGFWDPASPDGTPGRTAPTRQRPGAFGAP